MENLVIKPTEYGTYYKSKRVLITGHTGFKGSWLIAWLSRFNCDICGISLKPQSTPNHFAIIDNKSLRSEYIDINDFETLSKCFANFKPEIVFHLAAQALVRPSYIDPLYTWQTNIIGTANVLEAAKKCGTVRAILNITSDKCYKNLETSRAYAEQDYLGGFDPYSSSKACAEIISESYRNSYFNLANFGITHNTLLATARAGNVIGGGDWSIDRLIPDIVKATVANETVVIRSPLAVRPWQHVLEPLNAYLLLGIHLLEANTNVAEAWNVGPDEEDTLTVLELLKKCHEKWPDIKYEAKENDTLHEAGLLKLDSSKIRGYLGWKSVWSSDEAVEKTIGWYQAYYRNKTVNTSKDIDDYLKDCEKLI